MPSAPPLRPPAGAVVRRLATGGFEALHLYGLLSKGHAPRVTLPLDVPTSTGVLTNKEEPTVADRNRGVLFGRFLLAIGDVACWLVAGLALLGARYDFDLNQLQWGAVWIYGLTAIVLQLVIGYITKLYRGMYRIGSFEGTALLTVVVFVVAMISGAVAFMSTEFPRGLVVSVPPPALLLMFSVRWVLRMMSESHRPQLELVNESENALVYGAGDAGLQIYRLNKLAQQPPLNIIGFIDDDPLKSNQRFGQTPVLGTGKQLLEIARKHGVTAVVLAITGVSSQFIQDLAHRTDRAGIKLLMLPPLHDMLQGDVQSINQLHAIDVNDLLGRPAIHTDLRVISDYLTGKKVLITGAGGSIGSEIARQVHKFSPAELALLDRDESALHSVQLSIYGTGLLDSDDMILCDIRDEEALDAVFAKHRPEVVFHAAALKHLPMLERFPAEGWKTNVLGSLNVLTCAARHKVKRYVNISTDKAADPTAVLGKTKRIAEQLTAWFAAKEPGTFLSVRFGNVLGSRGSMLHTFTAQIDRGGPITVTDPDVERYFMTIPEACELTIQAGAIGQDGDVLVLNMGTPIKIMDVARRLIARSGRDIKIVITGLRPGEKLTEVLFAENERAVASSHPLINHVEVPPLDPALVTSAGIDYLDTMSSREQPGVIPLRSKGTVA